MLVEMTDENFGELLEDAVRHILFDYSEGDQSGRRLLAMLERLVSDAQPIAVEMDSQDAIQ